MESGVYGVQNAVLHGKSKPIMSMMRPARDPSIARGQPLVADVEVEVLAHVRRVRALVLEPAVQHLVQAVHGLSASQSRITFGEGHPLVQVVLAAAARAVRSLGGRVLRPRVESKHRKDRLKYVRRSSSFASRCSCPRSGASCRRCS